MTMAKLEYTLYLKYTLNKSAQKVFFYISLVITLLLLLLMVTTS